MNQNISFYFKKHENAGIKHLHDQKAFIEHSIYVDDVYNNIMITWNFNRLWWHESRHCD